jgi:hypothetical protein
LKKGKVAQGNQNKGNRIEEEQEKRRAGKTKSRKKKLGRER